VLKEGGDMSNIFNTEDIIRSIPSGRVLIVVEGYEMVGKSTLVRELTTELKSSEDSLVINTSSYLNHDIGSLIGYDNLYSSALIISDIVKNSNMSDIIVVQDRGLRSSLFYPHNNVLDDQVDTNNSVISKYYESYDTIIVITISLNDINNNLLSLCSSRGDMKFDPSSKLEYLENYNKFYNLSDDIITRSAKVYRNSGNLVEIDIKNDYKVSNQI
jgi:thymidylate kinase